MAPKKGGKKGKKKEDSLEPQHDASWERTVESGVWEKSVTDLPDANTWPTWGALRERVLTACKEIKIQNTASLRDAFANEIVKLSPPELTLIDFKGSLNLRNFVLSPIDQCPKLMDLDLSECASLGYVLLQSNSLKNLCLDKCPELTKALIHCPGLQKLSFKNCPKLETVMVWSDILAEIDMEGCSSLTTVKLHCPNLFQSVDPTPNSTSHVRPSHPPVAAVLRENLYVAAAVAEAAQEREWSGLRGNSHIAPVFRPF
uniref:Uncharacterized protein n=1 Tax=Polytomella parva TaxID=51329 RepID=A0A7S0V1B3_9CHLO|mmetsp:Transcript_2348/g.3557  ORF Transcript_2348/g.3557 Transcript_2348/m.3557 type:complete len:258 (+) Transcript_2348:48-821(+)